MRFSDAPTFSPRPQAPRLAAGDVVLRGHELADFDAFWRFHETTDRAGHMGAPESRTDLWQQLSAEIVSWQFKGFGSWAIETGGVLAGQVAITQPPHFPEIEIGWTLLDGYEGRGIAGRGARLALDWFWSHTGAETVVSYISPGNARSIALARRLGATHDPAAPLPDGETAADTVVYRHSADADGSPEAYA
jgi:RimJ/RimL family protein N-acetyltransferase